MEKCDPDAFQERHSDITHTEMVRGYECEVCHERYAEVVSRRDKPKKKCPDCGTLTLDSLIMGIPTCFPKSITTVGQYWEKVRKRELGSYGLQEEEKRRKDEFEQDLKNATAGDEYFDKPTDNSKWLRDKRIK
jgi:predicted nucleic acid-binding Zn ribbon protein